MVESQASGPLSTSSICRFISVDLSATPPTPGLHKDCRGHCFYGLRISGLQVFLGPTEAPGFSQVFFLGQNSRKSTGLETVSHTDSVVPPKQWLALGKKFKPF